MLLLLYLVLFVFGTRIDATLRDGTSFHRLVAAPAIPPFLLSLPFFPFAGGGALVSGGAGSGKAFPNDEKTESIATFASTYLTPYRFDT